VRQELGSWRFLSGAELGRTSAAHPSIADDRYEYRQSVFAQADGPIGAVRVFPALRIDRYDVQDEVRTAVSPSIAANAAPWPAAPVRARVSIGQSFRMPTFNDRFWTPGGNPELRPEQGFSADTGLNFESERLSADVGVFLMNVRDQIVWRPTSEGLWSPRNLTRTRAVGAEASGSFVTQVSGLPIGMNMSYRLTDVRDRSDPDATTYNRLLRYRPRHTFSALASTIIRSVDISMSLTGAGRVYTTDDQSRWLDPHAVMTVRVARPFVVGSSMIRLTAEVDNLFDSQYALVENRPMPPRHFRMGLQLNTSSRQ
jgi:vitamin B12 transporter